MADAQRVATAAHRSDAARNGRLRFDGRVHSVELVLDDDTDLAIRRQWAALLDAGLPSQGRHRGASNRPHITMTLAESLDAADLAGLASAVSALPLPVTVGGLVLFGARRFVLARLAIPSTELLAVQAELVGALARPANPHGTFSAGRWTPHVTLARKLTADQLAVALTVLGDMPPVTGTLTAARRWDIAAKQEQWIDPSDPA